MMRKETCGPESVANITGAPGGAERVFVAIDGGGSKTLAVAFLPDGTVIGSVRAGGANPNGAGEAFADLVARVWARLSAIISGRGARIAGVGAGLAGGGHPQVRERLRVALAEVIGMETGIFVTHDALIALRTGLAEGAGMALLAGTGTIVFGLDAGGNELRAGGWGHLLGDEGGGFDIGRRAVRVMMAEHEQGLAPGRLASRILAEWGIAHAPDVIPVVYAADGKRRLAALAPVVLALAESGDARARSIALESMRGLVSLLANARRVAADAARAMPVVLAGGLWSSAWFSERFFDRVREDPDLATVRFVRPDLPPVFGAARCLLQHLGVPEPVGFEEQFRRSWASEEPVALESASAPGGEGGTEGSDPALGDIELMSTPRLARVLVVSHAHAVSVVESGIAAVAAAADLVAEKLAGGGRLFYAGAGTSGRLGVLDASECLPTFGVSPDRVQGMIAGGAEAIVRSVEGAEDDERQGALDTQARGVGPRDVVVALAASGRTPWCLGVLRQARALGAATIALSCNRNAPMSALADRAIELPTGPEVLAGSTRLKAGTAQKVVLNTLSTIAMIRIGKVFRSRMVDLVVNNAKLRTRARCMVMQLGGLDDEAQAGAILDAAGGRVKVAIVMARLGVSSAEAVDRLAAHKGFLRQVFQAKTPAAPLPHPMP